MPPPALTRGCHHIGLTVSRLEDSAGFFTGLLGWEVLHRDADYPAIHVSDGTLLVTLWQVLDRGHAAGFDMHHQVGLHHVALAVDSPERLAEIHTRLVGAADRGVRIEFAPEPLHGGPAHHMMCYEPSGIRVEFIWPG